VVNGGTWEEEVVQVAGAGVNQSRGEAGVAGRCRTAVCRTCSSRTKRQQGAGRWRQVVAGMQREVQVAGVAGRWHPEPGTAGNPGGSVERTSAGAGVRRRTACGSAVVGGKAGRTEPNQAGRTQTACETRWCR